MRRSSTTTRRSWSPTTPTKVRYGPFADRLLAAYPTEPNAVPKTARDLTRDAAFGWHTWIWARLEAKTGKSKVFYYCFDQHPEYPAGSPRAGYGSPHDADVLYVFQHLDPSNHQVTKEDEAISHAMATYWRTSLNAATRAETASPHGRPSATPTRR